MPRLSFTVTVDDNLPAEQWRELLQRLLTDYAGYHRPVVRQIDEPKELPRGR